MDFEGKPRYRSKKPKKSQGTDQQEWGDLYLGFSLIFLICTWVFHIKACFGEPQVAKPKVGITLQKRTTDQITKQGYRQGNSRQSQSRDQPICKPKPKQGSTLRSPKRALKNLAHLAATRRESHFCNYLNGKAYD